MKSPYVFDEYFASGKEESISPFLTPSSRKWAKNLSLKTSSLAAFLLIGAFILSFISFDISRLALVFVYFFAGIPALIDTFEDLMHLEINIDVLMTLAAFLSILIGSEMEGALLLVLFSFSGGLEQSVSQKAKGAIQNLGKLCPSVAKVILQDGSICERSTKEIPVGAHLFVKAGEVIPLDGKIVSGKAFINLAHLTGESAPIPKKEGDELQAGCINLDGTLTIEVLRISNDSTLARIIELIENAQEAKPKLQRLFDRFGKAYSISIIGLSCCFALFLPYFFSIAYFGIEGSIYRALTFLIAASPCALIIATPTAYLSAISACAKRGILLKGGFTLDALASCNTFAFDKTGTLTTGKLVCTGVKSLTSGEKECTEEMAIAIAASLEKNVLHPIAEAITEYAHQRNAALIPIKDFKAIPGFGIEAAVHIQGEEIKISIGHFDFIKEKIHTSIFPQRAQEIHEEGKLSALLLYKKTVFIFYFIDEIRPGIQEFLNNLKKQHIQLAMLTGDHHLNAKHVAEKVGIDEFYADLRPDDKLNLVANLSKYQGLAMIGDGINDAPALARSTVGISMGKIGSRTAIEASDIVLLADDLSLLHWLLRRAHKTMRIVKQNLFLALSVIFCATTPALLGFIPLWLAVILHEGGTVIVGFNSLRLLKRR